MSLEEQIGVLITVGTEGVLERIADVGDNIVMESNDMEHIRY